MFPQSNYLPPAAPKTPEIRPIPLTVAGDFLSPIWCKLAAPLLESPSVPEIAIYEYSDLCADKHQIWTSGQTPLGESKPESARVYELPNDKLRLGISALDSRHRIAALLDCQIVSQRCLLREGYPPLTTTLLLYDQRATS
jgi:hypothetical protein